MPVNVLRKTARGISILTGFRIPAYTAAARSQLLDFHSHPVFDELSLSSPSESEAVFLLFLMLPHVIRVPRRNQMQPDVGSIGPDIGVALCAGFVSSTTGKH